MAASNSPSGERKPHDLRSFLSSPEFRILLGAGSGYVARRLWDRPQEQLNSKLAELKEAPTIPISSLKNYKISGKGELVVIQDGMVFPLSSVPAAKYTDPEPRTIEAVVSRTVNYTDQPKELEKVFKGTRHVEVNRVPFALVAGRFYGRESFVIVNNADPDQLPLEHESTVKAPLDPPVTLTTRLTVEEEEKEAAPKTEYEVRTRIRVNKVTEQSVLRTGTRLESVFGILRMRNGMPEIEPCSTFPKKCFVMGRDEIKREVWARANADVYPSRRFGAGLGLVSLGLLLSGFYSYGMS